MDIKSNIFIAGHKGLVGSNLLKELNKRGYKNLIYKSSSELNLLNQTDVLDFFYSNAIDYVFMSAAKVGGIKKMYENPATFLYENTLMQANVIHSAYLSGVKKYLFLGSASVYPNIFNRPIKESEVMTGILQPEHEAYAIAKINGIKMAGYYKKQYGFNSVSAILSNVYGPKDKFQQGRALVIPALIDQFHKAKINQLNTVYVWGKGQSKREFIHVDDLVDALILIMNSYNDNEPINVSLGEETTILDLAYIIKEVVEFRGEIKLKPSMPEGPKRKLLDNSKLNALGFKARIDLKDGIKDTYKWYLDNIANR